MSLSLLRSHPRTPPRPPPPRSNNFPRLSSPSPFLLTLTLTLIRMRTGRRRPRRRRDRRRKSDRGWSAVGGMVQLLLLFRLRIVQEEGVEEGYSVISRLERPRPGRRDRGRGRGRIITTFCRHNNSSRFKFLRRRRAARSRRGWIRRSRRACW